MGIYWRGLRFLEVGVEEKKEVTYCAVCEDELATDGGRTLLAPSNESIIVCEACFETRPPGYQEERPSGDNEE